MRASVGFRVYTIRLDRTPLGFKKALCGFPVVLELQDYEAA